MASQPDRKCPYPSCKGDNSHTLMLHFAFTTPCSRCYFACNPEFMPSHMSIHGEIWQKPTALPRLLGNCLECHEDMQYEEFEKKHIYECPGSSDSANQLRRRKHNQLLLDVLCLLCMLPKLLDQFRTPILNAIRDINKLFETKANQLWGSMDKMEGLYTRMDSEIDRMKDICDRMDTEMQRMKNYHDRGDIEKGGSEVGNEMDKEESWNKDSSMDWHDNSDTNANMMHHDAWVQQIQPGFRPFPQQFLQPLPHHFPRQSLQQSFPSFQQFPQSPQFSQPGPEVYQQPQQGLYPEPQTDFKA